MYYPLQALIVFYQFFKTLYSLLDLCGIEVCGIKGFESSESDGDAPPKAATATKTHPEREPLIPNEERTHEGLDGSMMTEEEAIEAAIRASLNDCVPPGGPQTQTQTQTRTQSGQVR